VLWRGNEPIGDLPAIFEQIRARDWKVILATNNATRTAEQYVEHMKSYAVTIEPWQVVNSGQVAARYLKKHFPQGGAVYVVGSEALIQTLAESGFTLAERDVVAVVAGIDRGLTYDKLRRATLLIRAGAPFIGTNPDKTFPTPEGLIPGAGAVLAAIEAATSIPPIIMGKPAPEMYQAALDRLNLLPEQVMVVGDRLETDIAGAQLLGLRTALVLSGVSTETDARAWQPQPDIIAPDLARVVAKTIISYG
jgi:4-nitrophenyl phosphatase